MDDRLWFKIIEGRDPGELEAAVNGFLEDSRDVDIEFVSNLGIGQSYMAIGIWFRIRSDIHA